LEGQVDFARELHMLRRLRRAFARDTSVLLPAPLDSLCGPAVITMELLDGFTAPRSRADVPDASLTDAAKAGLEALYRMIFVEGLVHCDLHGGNFRLLPGGRIAIVDFGLMMEMDRSDRLRFSEFFYAVATSDGPLAAAITLECAASVAPKLAYARFESEMVALVTAVGKTPSTFSVSSFVTELLGIQQRHGIVSSTAFVSAIAALFVFEGIVRQYLTDFDYQGMAQRYIFLGSFAPGPETDQPRPKYDPRDRVDHLNRSEGGKDYEAAEPGVRDQAGVS
jgi:ubiquinone biosynthesis protein